VALHHGQMPPTLVITDERDVLRSQGEEFAKRLEAAGAMVTATRYEGVMHEFFGASAVLDKAEAAPREAADHFLKACGATPTPTRKGRPAAPGPPLLRPDSSTATPAARLLSGGGPTGSWP